MSMGTPVTPAKIPPVVPLAAADAERQKLYGGLEKARQEELGKKVPGFEPDPSITPPMASDSAPTPPITTPDSEDAQYDPTEEDKQAFVRALLGGNAFEKRYMLFGQIEAAFVDRTTEQTEQMYALLQKDGTEGRIKTDTDEYWTVWLERYSLASNLREYTQTGAGRKTFPPTDKLFERAQEFVKLPKPLYQALMQSNRVFEVVVDKLTQKAQDPNFWPTGGAASRSKPTSVAR